MSRELFVEAVELGDIDMLEEEIVPCTGCGCECAAPTPAPPRVADGGGDDGSYVG
jgi:hypothetical protein